MNEFNIVLSSQDNKLYFEHNRPANFHCRLHQPISLYEFTYEIALVSIFFNRKWDAKLKPFCVHIDEIQDNCLYYDYNERDTFIKTKRLHFSKLIGFPTISELGVKITDKLTGEILNLEPRSNTVLVVRLRQTRLDMRSITFQSHEIDQDTFENDSPFMFVAEIGKDTHFPNQFFNMEFAVESVLIDYSLIQSFEEEIEVANVINLFSSIPVNVDYKFKTLYHIEDIPISNVFAWDKYLCYKPKTLLFHKIDAHTLQTITFALTANYMPFLPDVDRKTLQGKIVITLIFQEKWL